MGVCSPNLEGVVFVLACLPGRRATCRKGTASPVSGGSLGTPAARTSG